MRRDRPCAVVEDVAEVAVGMSIVSVANACVLGSPSGCGSTSRP